MTTKAKAKAFTAKTCTSNQGTTRWSAYFMTHDRETYLSFGDPLRVVVFSGEDGEAKVEEARQWAIKVCNAPADCVMVQMEDEENYPETQIYCDADEFGYNDAVAL